LLAFENAHPHLENLIKSLLRSYEGIFDNEVSINEKLLARLTKLLPEELNLQLKELQAFGIINYAPQKETPQIFFLQNRAPAQHLSFRHAPYLKRKQQYQLRIDAMEKFITLQRNCRSQYVGKYFGDDKMKQCGVCDNCLQQKNVHLSAEEFTQISESILFNINEKVTEIKILLNNLNGFKKDKIWKVLNYLQSEGKVVVNENGLVELL